MFANHPKMQSAYWYSKVVNLMEHLTQILESQPQRSSKAVQ